MFELALIIYTVTMCYGISVALSEPTSNGLEYVLNQDVSNEQVQKTLFITFLAMAVGSYFYLTFNTPNGDNFGNGLEFFDNQPPPGPGGDFNMLKITEELITNDIIKNDVLVDTLSAMGTGIISNITDHVIKKTTETIILEEPEIILSLSDIMGNLSTVGGLKYVLLVGLIGKLLNIFNSVGIHMPDVIFVDGIEQLYYKFDENYLLVNKLINYFSIKVDVRIPKYDGVFTPELLEYFLNVRKYKLLEGFINSYQSLEGTDYYNMLVQICDDYDIYLQSFHFYEKYCDYNDVLCILNLEGCLYQSLSREEMLLMIFSNVFNDGAEVIKPTFEIIKFYLEELVEIGKQIEVEVNNEKIPRGGISKCIDNHIINMFKSSDYAFKIFIKNEILVYRELFEQNEENIIQLIRNSDILIENLNFFLKVPDFILEEIKNCKLSAEKKDILSYFFFNTTYLYDIKKLYFFNQVIECYGLGEAVSIYHSAINEMAEFIKYLNMNEISVLDVVFFLNEFGHLGSMLDEEDLKLIIYMSCYESNVSDVIDLNKFSDKELEIVYNTLMGLINKSI